MGVFLAVIPSEVRNLGAAQDFSLAEDFSLALEMTGIAFNGAVAGSSNVMPNAFLPKFSIVVWWKGKIPHAKLYF